jgi:phage terminase Nu1 subunit (DNA packaging protein)
VNEESAREKHWKANRAELDYRERIGQLVDAEEMKAAIADAFARVRARLSGLPTRLRQQIPHLKAEDVVVVEDFLREALDELALKFEKDEEEDDEVAADGDGGS